MSDDAVMQSFELAAERAGDILPSVYEAYFTRCPESRELMRLVDTHMRGRMMDSVLLLLMGEAATEQRSYLRFETSNHVSYGVLPHMYENLLHAIHDTVRDAVGADWTQAMQQAWSERLRSLLEEIHEVAASSA